MTVSKAQKEASKKYHREHIASLACRVKKEEAEQFKAYCASIGLSTNAVLRNFVMECIQHDKDAGAREALREETTE